ncbi:extensin-like domain-containing protein [Ovoidimarina sediminis]|uniref:extensin-like domain-containing protein n=1 Tax=Ovoidimarina sediminis TaxID=3079856 RepID=UPI00290A363D|nr:extensin family protein [Rhodophyticola sp. MJ-SS7]MDU8942905.1 extensin family protein [Rhodophyticola sp. MJ-SS7]
MKWAALLLMVLAASCGRGGGDDLTTRDATCGIPGLVAVPRAPIVEGACGMEGPVVVTRVAGVDLSRPSIMTCQTASALDTWVREGARPAIGRRGGGLAELSVAAHYACRTRNSQPGARLSEHARGKAIDISGLVMADGSRVTVTDGWSKDRDGALLRRLHRAACGPFGTVLGPEADRHHQTHLHFDVASHRGGPYCR